MLSFPCSYGSVQFGSVAQSCPTFCDSMDCSMPAPPSIANSQSLLKLMSIESVMPSNHLILYLPLLLFPSIFPSIRVFSNESVICIRWPKYWNFSFSISPSSEYSGLISSSMLAWRVPWTSPRESDTTELIWLRAKNKLQNGRTRIEKS